MPNIVSFGSPSQSDDAIEEVLDEGDKTFASLTSSDIKYDPILSSLARAQKVVDSPNTSTRQNVFKAKPAPKFSSDVGPRMTKSAALRQGLDWEALDKKHEKERKEVGFENTPGHKRAGLGLMVKSLATPSLTPRQTKASQLRAGGDVTQSAKKDREAIAAANKARDGEERQMRRKSIALPSSLSAPSIVPRTNKAAALRTGQPSMSSPARRPQFPLSPTGAANVIPGSNNASPAVGQKMRRGSLTGLSSLGTPTIMPRMNKAALLRAPVSSSTVPTVTSSPNPPVRPTHKKTSTLASIPTMATPPASSGKKVSPPSASAASSIGSSRPRPMSMGPGPRPTKASLLRAGLGAKVA
ncbi:hypothetical protein TREMEDRAFT_67600 [Tremella mesenterica DSM 1558]|nr:uncharacterized protein TREMEDRAFT_67600 [Tremella mesenterica DSM 1558]EIW71158.1 hypothetical protein TREMEDRAFT_67600 [Tremella mesenterica DSM 1558]